MKGDDGLVVRACFTPMEVNIRTESYSEEVNDTGGAGHEAFERYFILQRVFTC